MCERQVGPTGYSSLSSPASSIDKHEQGTKTDEHGRLTDTDRTTTSDDDVLGIGKLGAPGVDVGQYIAFMQRKVGGPSPLGPRGNDEDLVWDPFAALQDDMPAGLGVSGLDGLDDADLGLGVAFLEEPVEGNERGVLELGGLADDETQGRREGDGIWTGADEDEVVLGRVEFGGEGGGDGYSGVASADNDDVFLGGHFGAAGMLDLDMAALLSQRPSLSEPDSEVSQPDR